MSGGCDAKGSLADFVKATARWVENQCKSTSRDHSGSRVVACDLDAVYTAMGCLIENVDPADGPDADAIYSLGYWCREAIDRFRDHERDRVKDL